MAKIFKMPPHLADLIAAGEVVERPGSVVKELVENSIDAGATVLTVEIKNGGMSYIRVTDNGSGISPEDAQTAFLRHATSKLRTHRDLEAIGTLGFRGEALAAIAAVSRIELITRERGSSEGVRLTLEGSAIMTEEPAGCPEGTTIIIRDLFFNTPARLKFMKNDRAEGSNVTTVVTRLALSHPEVSIKYIKDGKEECHTPGDGRMESAVYSTLGRDIAKGLLPVKGESGGVDVSGFISTPAACRGNRSWQFFFLNGRFIKSKLLQAAVEQAYKNSLFTGRFPACMLDIRLNLSSVDVNVHPTKTEVRFSDERAVFDAVHWAVRGALEEERPGASMTISSGTEKAVKTTITPDAPKPLSASGISASSNRFTAAPRSDFYKSMPAEEYKKSFSPAPLKSGTAGYKPADLSKVQPAPVRVHSPIAAPLSAPISEPVSRPEPSAPVQLSIPMPAPQPRWEPEETVEAAPAEASWRYIGEALDTYLIVEQADCLYLIDKHAAHERILFDRLKSTATPPEGQLLLAPLVCSVGRDAARVIGENGPTLESFGIEAEPLGDDTVILRQVPQGIDVGDGTAFMEEIAEKLSLAGRLGLEDMRDEVMHSVACKAAIKAGSPSERQEVRDLIEKVLSGEVKYCPHGRPVSLELTKAQIDKSFKRT